VSLRCRDDKTLKPVRRNLVRSWQEQEAHFFLTLAPLTGAVLPHRYLFEPLISYVVALANVLVECAYGKSSKVFKRCSAQGSRSTKTQQVSRYTFAAWLSNRRLKRPQSGRLGRIRCSLDQSSPPPVPDTLPCYCRRLVHSKTENFASLASSLRRSKDVRCRNKFKNWSWYGGIPSLLCGEEHTIPVRLCLQRLY
jgi:hypothetical protein